MYRILWVLYAFLVEWQAVLWMLLVLLVVWQSCSMDAACIVGGLAKLFYGYCLYCCWCGNLRLAVL